MCLKIYQELDVRYTYTFLINDKITEKSRCWCHVAIIISNKIIPHSKDSTLLGGIFVKSPSNPATETKEESRDAGIYLGIFIWS